jgi:hypothetical protein
MAGARKNGRLQSRAARTGLKEQHAPLWFNVAEGVSLGYRRGSLGGAWYVRIYEGNGRYRQFVNDHRNQSRCDHVKMSRAGCSFRGWM